MLMNRTILFIFIVGVLLTTPDSQSSAQQPGAPDDTGNYNLKLKTMGGTQFWTDVRVEGNWRIQQNSEFKHFRLLDKANVRQAWGTQEVCDQLLNSKLDDGSVKANGSKSEAVVILLHGLIRSGNSMSTMEKHLSNAGFETINFRYASTRRLVADHAAALKSVIDGLSPDVKEINFVCHSLGNIVVRHYLADNTDPVTGQQGDERVCRMVMMGPPNQGSKVARLFKKSMAFKMIAGASGRQLSESWSQLEPHLATPKFEFGIIAGGQADDAKFGNFMLKGKDDFTVSVEETKLVGASDFLVEPLVHSTMMNQPLTLESTERFLKQGHFRDDGSRFPIK